MKPFYQDSGVEKKLTEEKWHKFDSDFYLPSGWLQYMSYSRLFSSRTLNTVMLVRQLVRGKLESSILRETKNYSQRSILSRLLSQTQ